MPPKRTKATYSRKRPKTTNTAEPFLDDIEESQRKTPDFSTLPPEVLIRVSSYLHKSSKGDVHRDERYWDKSDLKAMNGVNRAFSKAAKCELFRFMTLMYTYDYDRQRKQWMVPKLVQMIEAEPLLFQAVKTYIKAVRFVIVPMPRSATQDLIEAEPSRMVVSAWAGFLWRRVQSGHPPCVFGGQRSQPWSDFDRFFGTDENADGGPVEETINYMLSIEHREVFASYISRTLRRLGSNLSNLTHIEAGQLPGEHQVYLDKPRYSTIMTYSSAFATTMMSKHKPATVASVRIYSLPFQTYHRDAQMPLPADFNWFCIGELHRGLVQHAQTIVKLDIDVSFHQQDPIRMFRPATSRTPWTSTVAYYTDLLKQLPSLTFLRLAKQRVDTLKDNDRMGGFLQSLFGAIRSSEMERLVLVGWSVAPLVLSSIHASFPELTDLDLESFTIVSDEENAASSTLNQLMSLYNNRLSISANDMVHRDTRRKVVDSWAVSLIERV